MEPSSSFTWRERLRYAFDNTLSRGTGALIAWLTIVTGVAIAIASAVLVVGDIKPEGGEALSFGEAMWQSLMRSLDSGAVAGDVGGAYRAIMFFVTVAGIFIFSTLIGVLSSGLEEQLTQLRKGRSRVVEQGHTVILGWSDQVFPILAELVEANRSSKRAAIVVLADKDKVEMEDAIRDKLADTASTRIVCRTGSPIEPDDLHIASIDQARSILVLAPEGPDGAANADPDVDVIKTLLALTNSPSRKRGAYHIVAEMRDPKNVQVAKMVGKDEVEVVLVGDLIARIMAQTCRQSGLSIVYTELLDFGGDEIYFKEEPSLVGKTFGDALFAYDTSSVIGVRPNDGPPLLNPPMHRTIAPGDRLIVVAADDAAVRLAQRTGTPDEAAIALRAPPASAPERSLLLGWNWRAPHVLNELDAYVAAGSEAVVVTDVPGARDALAKECRALQHMTLEFREGDTTDRALLDALEPTRFDHVLVLCDSDVLEMQKADARVLITLLHLRDIAARTGKRIPVVSEMLDVKNRALAEVTQADDFIVSDRIVSLLLSQIAENKELNRVFSTLFSPEGSEIYLKPIDQYVQQGVSMTFHSVVEAARRKGEVAFGYRKHALASDATRAYGVVVNPDKTRALTFAPGDRVIVLAES